jgi:hypothetical protein
LSDTVTTIVTASLPVSFMLTLLCSTLSTTPEYVARTGAAPGAVSSVGEADEGGGSLDTWGDGEGSGGLAPLVQADNPSSASEITSIAAIVFIIHSSFHNHLIPFTMIFYTT